MKTRSTIWFFLCPIAFGCGYAGLGDLQQEQVDATDLNGSDTGGAAGDGDLGDGDMSLGGSMTDRGGADSGTGGADRGTGGADRGTGGADSGTGGRGGGGSGSGGSDTSTGGSEMGTGGTWQPDDVVWSDPNRVGCEPFCSVEFNPAYATHYLFEQTVVPAPGVESNGQLFVATDRSNWGVSSLGVKFDESDAYAYIPTDIEVDQARTIFVRAWLFVPSGVVTGDLGLLEFLSGDVPAGLVTTHPGARLSVETPIDDQRAMSAAGTYPFDEWFCLRAAVYSDDQEGSITVEADNVIVAEILGADTRDLIDVNTVNFGVTGTGPFQGEGTIYWDSLIIDQQSVACDDASGL